MENNRNDSIIKNIKENCTGYFYSYNCDPKVWTIGSDKDRELLPMEVLSRVSSINGVVAWINDIPSFSYFSKHTGLNERQRKKIGEECKRNGDNILVYNAPLNVRKTAKMWEDYNTLRLKFNDSKNYTPAAQSFEGYLERLTNRFLEPFLVFNRNCSFQGGQGSSSEFYLVGEIAPIGDFMSLLLKSPESIKSLISEILDVDAERALRGYSYRNNLVVYDTNSYPKKQVKRINWEAA